MKDTQPIPAHIMAELQASILKQQAEILQKAFDDSERERIYDEKPWIQPSNVKRSKLLAHGCAWLALALFVGTMVAFVLFL